MTVFRRGVSVTPATRGCVAAPGWPRAHCKALLLSSACSTT
eukprot:CAMPEP_0118995170 /NCGR_PEP_ID=MMETSP1173-20130426/58051_1 /TAXON_ID=1034831 /ORGANISM="Rhizochromulina marina cf, Strain CCMP1243" /LENGTH=40 /DNA_ID= /DNA_START= /DNA_END= /DNA_ORIENTATION=